MLLAVVQRSAAGKQIYQHCIGYGYLIYSCHITLFIGVLATFFISAISGEKAMRVVLFVDAGAYIALLKIARKR